MDVYYKNHMGETINLKEKPYYMLTGDLLDYKWNAMSSGNRITGFSKGIYEKKVEFETFTTRDKYHHALDKVTEVFEKDILAGVPGKLYINHQYLQCYIVGSTKTQWEADILAVTDLVIVTDYPYWVTEKEYQFQPVQEESRDNKQYPYRYVYRYSNGASNLELLNEHYGDTDFKLVIYGPVSNPAVVVSEHLYQVNVLLEQGEYITVDSRKNTIIVTRKNGGRVNVFNHREKESDIFRKIPHGMSRVHWNGSFGFDLVLLQERSQPKCA